MVLDRLVVGTGRTAVTPRRHPTVRPSRRLAVALGVAGLIVGGLAVRLWLCGLPLGQFDGDEATTGLMVRQILHGHFYVYMAGQDYNGALEQYLQAAVWAVAPQNTWTLRSVDLGLFVATAVVIYRAARVYFREFWRRLTAVGIFCLGPYFNVWKGIHSHGAYSVGQLIGATSVLLAAQLSRARVRRPAARLFALGLLLGLSYWLAWTTFIVVAPAALWMLPLVRQRALRLLHVLAGAVVGAAPAIGYAITHGRLPGLGGVQPPSTVAQRLHGLAEPITREFFGLGYRYGRPGLPMPVQQLALVLVAATFVVCVVKRRRQLLSSLIGVEADREASDVLLLVPFFAALAFAGSRYSWWTGEPRYVFAAYPALALGVPAVLALRSRWALLAGATAVALAGVSTLTVIARHGNDGPRAEAACLSTVARDLDAAGVTRVYSDYWTGMPLQMVAGTQLVVAPVGGGRTKFPFQRRIVDQMQPIYYLAGHIPDPMNEERDDVAKVRAALRVHHVRAQSTPLGGCAVLFSGFTPQVRPWQIGLGRPIS